MNIVSISGKGPPTQEMCILGGVSFHNSAKIWIPDFPLEVLTKYMSLGRFPLCSKHSRSADNNLVIYIPQTHHGELKFNVSRQGGST